LDAERFIHTAIFVLLLVGLCTVSGWASYTYISDLVLKIAGVTITWAVVLLALYLGFKKLDWVWWS
jgi:hypothetical protein